MKTGLKYSIFLGIRKEEVHICKSKERRCLWGSTTQNMAGEKMTLFIHKESKNYNELSYTKILI